MQQDFSHPTSWKNSPFVLTFVFLPWVAALYLVVANYVVNLSPEDKVIIGNFIEWFGTAYSLFLALVLGYVWAQFDNLDREFDLEADALASLHQTSSYISTVLSTEQLGLSEGQKEKIIGYINDIEKGIATYVKHVIKNYETEYKNAQQRERGEKILNSIGRRISLITYDKSTPDTLVSELFGKLNEAMDIRGDRIAHSKQRMPSAVWLVSIVSSIIWLIPFLGLGIKDDYVFFFLVGGAAFVIIMVLAIVRDLDDPFNGAWKINIDSWYQFLEILEPTLIFVYNINDTFYDRTFKIVIGKLFRLKVCNLRTVTYQWGEEKKEWRKLRSQILEKEDIVTKPLLANQYLEDDCYNEIKVSQLPLVIYRSDNKFVLLLNSEDIDKCGNFIALNEAIKQKLVESGRSYQVN